MTEEERDRAAKEYAVRELREFKESKEIFEKVKQSNFEKEKACKEALAKGYEKIDEKEGISEGEEVPF